MLHRVAYNNLSHVLCHRLKSCEVTVQFNKTSERQAVRWEIINELTL